MSTVWERKRIGEIADHSLGKMLDRAKNRGEPKHYLRNLNVRWFEFDLSDMLEMRFLPEEAGKYTAVKGDLLICEGGYPGRAAIWERDDPVYFQKALHRVRFHEPERAKWFLYYLHALDLEGTLKKYFNGAGIQHFTGEALARFELPLPPLPEQRRILAVLDEAHSDIAGAAANAEKNLQNARRVFEAHLHSVFGEHHGRGTIRTVAELARHSLGKMLDKAKNRGDLQPYLRNLNVRWFDFDLTDLLEMRFLPEEFSKYTAAKGDVLVCEGGYPGRAAIWDQETPMYFQKAVHRVRFHEPALGPWFVYYLYAQDRAGTLKRHFNGAGIQHFTGEALARFRIPVPPISELRNHTSRFESLQRETKRLEALYARKAAMLDELKRALLHRAFTGQL